MSVANTSLPIEIERNEIDEHTVQSVYQAGYGCISVKSIFGTKHCYSDLLRNIIQRKIQTVSIT